ncbi:MAG: hypothetical protein LWW86_09165 [Micrococcales bacterium]|nr:hypothetical protein [Micrococcales bacterium]
MSAPDSSISPGFGAFLAFFLLALALWLLMRSMGGVLRRMSYRQEDVERAEAARRSGEQPVDDVSEPLAPDTAEPVAADRAEPVVPDRAEPVVPDRAEPVDQGEPGPHER